MSMEDKQNHARRAFENAREARQPQPPEKRQEVVRPPPPPPKMELKPKGVRTTHEHNQTGLARTDPAEAEKIRAAIAKAKQGLTERSAKKDFDRER